MTKLPRERRVTARRTSAASCTTTNDSETKLTSATPWMRPAVRLRRHPAQRSVLSRRTGRRGGALLELFERRAEIPVGFAADRHRVGIGPGERVGMKAPAREVEAGVDLVVAQRSHRP